MLRQTTTWPTNKKCSTSSSQNMLKFNLGKYIFSTINEKFVCFMITQRAIEINPNESRQH